MEWNPSTFNGNSSFRYDCLLHIAFHSTRSSPSSSYLLTDRSDKRYELDGEDRVEWNAIWSRQSYRKLELPLKVEGFHSINNLQSGCGKMVSATISEDPVEFSDQVIREIDSCPICGRETL